MVLIGEAARRSGVGVETIRYYERTGVVPAPGRSASGRRAYREQDISRLRFIRRCRDLGFPLSDCKSLAGLAGDGLACTQAQQLGRKHLEAIQAKRAELDRLEAALAHLMQACGSGRESCSLLEALAERPDDDWPF